MSKVEKNCAITERRFAEIPNWLLEMSEHMISQDPRSTPHPFFQVRCKRFYVTEKGYSEHHWELIHEDDEGQPTYSSEEYADNVALSQDFYERNKKWCNEWIKENTDLEWLGEDDCFYDYFDFRHHKEDGEEWPEGYRIVYLQEIEEVVSTHLTEADANWFIWRKQHDYPKLYTYAESAYWSPQLKQLQDWIKSLTN